MSDETLLGRLSCQRNLVRRIDIEEPAYLMKSTLGSRYEDNPIGSDFYACFRSTTGWLLRKYRVRDLHDLPVDLCGSQVSDSAGRTLLNFH
jgi:hypothetical protein